MTTTTSTTEFIAQRMQAADFATLVERYAPNALLDCHTPFWRFQLQGPSAIAEYAHEAVDALPNVHTTALRTTLAADAVVVEYELRWDGPEGEELSRAVSIFRLVDDVIVEQVDYCCGNWTPSHIAKNKAEAPMVRW
jgi:predicted SnoaL-like aldol condensation-catalyzing enzyme